jgi:hypothetical protein
LLEKATKSGKSAISAQSRNITFLAKRFDTAKTLAGFFEQEAP